MSEWEPIATAPKNGTRILVSLPNKTMTTVFWAADYTGKNFEWRLCVPGEFAEDNLWGEPTHWMYLPMPPKAP